MAKTDHQNKLDVLSELDVDEILSRTKVVQVTNTTDHQPHLNDIELDDLDHKIAEKLDQIKARSSLISNDPGGDHSSRWLLRQETGTNKPRWLVARSVENELEISVDLTGLDAKPEQS